MDCQSEKGQSLTEFLVWVISFSALLIAIYNFEQASERHYLKYQFGKGSKNVRENTKKYFK